MIARIFDALDAAPADRFILAVGFFLIAIAVADRLAARRWLR